MTEKTKVVINKYVKSRYLRNKEEIKQRDEAIKKWDVTYVGWIALEKDVCYLFNADWTVKINKDWTPSRRTWRKSIAEMTISWATLNATSFRHEWAIKMVNKYGKFDNKMWVFPKPVDLMVAFKMYIKDAELNNTSTEPVYFSRVWFASWLHTSPTVVGKYKHKHWFEDVFEEMNEYKTNNLIENWLHKKFDAKIVKIMLSQHWIIEKTEKQINVNNNVQPQAMMINMPNITVEQLEALSIQQTTPVDVIDEENEW